MEDQTSSKTSQSSLTIEAVKPGDTRNVLPEFGRIRDVQHLFGIRRGLLYRWIKNGRVKSVCIREPGNKQGIRLVHLPSVRDFLQKQMQAAAEANNEG